MSLGVIRGAYGFYQDRKEKQKWNPKKKKQFSMDGKLLEPTGVVSMEIPITFTISNEELNRFGFSPVEQMRNNPRIREMLNKVM